MRIESLRMSNIRNHAASAAEFLPGINVLVGANGQGKTSVLEAVSLLCLTKSFTAVSDATVLRRGEEHFTAEGVMIGDTGTPRGVRVTYDATVKQKTVAVNGVPAETLASVIGSFPAVVLAPEFGPVTAGAPADRRRFLDMLLAQLSSSYLQDLLDYRRVLRQRNRLLALGPAVRTAGESIDAWNEGLLRSGSRLMRRRALALEEFRPYVRDAYAMLAGEDEEAEIGYLSAPAVAGTDALEKVERALATRLADVRREEERRRTSLAGPHRDDVRLSIGGLDVRQYASQGQHKSMLVALKVAEFHYLRERTGETPVLLLDDVFSELDPGRARRLLELVRGLGQTLLTTTEDSGLREACAARFEVRHGTITGTPR